MEPDELLPKDTYYFHVPNDYQYAVYPSFSEWEFPHRNLSAAWAAMEPTAASSLLTEDDALEILSAASNFTVGTIARARSCRVTHGVDGIEACHICSVEERTWFFENEMSVYNLNDILSPYVAISNAVALRADVHKIFDDKKFVLVPKAGRWLRHTHNMGSIFHNLPVELNSLVSVSFLLTRFAWGILPLVAGFVSAGVPRKLRLRQGTENEPEDVLKTKSETEALRMVVRGMNPSPKKRKRDDSNPTCAGPTNFTISATAEHEAMEMSVVGHKQSLEKVKSDDSSFPSIRFTDFEESYSSSVTPISEYHPHECFTKPSSRGPAEEPFSKEQEPDEIYSAMFPTVNPLSPMDTTLSHQTSSQVPIPDENALEASHLESLRQEWVRKQRPLDPKLYCCNYNDIESAMVAESGGNKELRSGRLCPLCLGWELRDDFDEEQTGG